MFPDRELGALLRKAFALACTGIFFQSTVAYPFVLGSETYPPSASAVTPLSPGDRLEKLADFNFDSIGEQQGLTNDSVYGFAQDKSGFLWIATLGGLFRFEGYQFQNYTHNPHDPKSLPDTSVRLILPRRDGGLWIGTGNAGIVTYDPATDSFHSLPQLPPALAHSHIFCMSEDGQGGLWFGSQVGLVHYNSTTQGYEIFGKAAGTANPAGFTQGDVFSVLVDTQGNLWAGGDSGLLMRPAHQTVFHSVLGRNGPGQIGERPPIWTIFEDHRHRIWIGTDTSGLGLFNRSTGHVEGVSGLAGAASLIGAHTVRGIVEAKPDELWIATYGSGLLTFNADTGVSTRHLRDVTTSSPLANNFLRGIYMDRMGVVWLATDRGISRVNSAADGILRIQPSTLRPKDAAGSEVRSVAVQGDRIWVGFDQGHLAVIEPDGKIREVQAALELKQEKLSQREILAIKVASENEIFAGGAGLYRIDPKALLYRPVNDPLIARKEIHSLEVDGQNLWIASEHGLICYNRDTHRSRIFLHDAANRSSLSDNYVRDVVKVSDGDFWVTTRMGLDRFDPQTGKFWHVRHDASDPQSIPDDSVGALAADREGRLWAGTIGDGLTVLTSFAKDGRPQFRAFRPQDGFPDNFALTVMRGADGRMWSSTPVGLAAVDPNNFRIQSYIPENGMRVTPQNLFSSAVLRDGTIVYPGFEGLMVIRPEKLKNSVLEPPFVMTGLWISGHSSNPIAEANRSIETGLTLLPGNRGFTAEFALLDFSAAPAARYSYRLEGFDRSWAARDTANRSATYTNLPPGSYRLFVQVRSGKGDSAKELTLPVTVLPAWYETTWFLVLKILAGIGIVFAVVRLRTAVLRKRQANLETQVLLRTTELLEANERLALLATRDPLTGTFNRRCFLEKAEVEFAQMRQISGTVALLLLDIDHFKSVNDTYGHAAGDEVLCVIARQLSSELRANDMIARHGGEEFVLLFPETSMDEGLVVAERLRRTVADEPVVYKEQTIKVTVSIGVAESNGDEALDHVLQRADEALYQAKREGRNRVVPAKPQQQVSS